MKLRPLGDRILIRPELPATETESGLILAEHRKPEQTGTVVAVGPCPHPRKLEAEALAAEFDAFQIDPAQPKMRQRMERVQALLRDLVRKTPDVKVGDYVVFSWTAGQEIWVEDGDDRYLLMRESDILAVVDGLNDLPACGDGESA